MGKTSIWNFLCIQNRKHIKVKIHALHLVLCWSTSAVITATSSWVSHYKLDQYIWGTPSIIPSSQLGWEHHSNCFRYFQRCSVKLCPTDVQRHPKPLLHTLFSWPCAYSYLGSCSRWNFSPEVLIALDQVFPNDLSAVSSVEHSLDTHSSFSTCKWKTSRQHEAGITVPHCRDG